MTYERMISDLVKLREHSMMPAVFKPTLNAILEYFAYDDAPKTTGWIPVSERLPEVDVEVLTTTDWSDVLIAWLNKDGAWETEELILNNDEILAWMPLPEPYREDEHE